LICIETQLEINSLNINELIDEEKDWGRSGGRYFFLCTGRGLFMKSCKKFGKRLGMLSVERYSCKYGNAKKNEKKNIG